MHKFILSFLSLSLFLNANDYASQVQGNSTVWGKARYENITHYLDGFSSFFIYMQQNRYFALGAAVVILAVIFGFALHYFIVGPKHFSHDGNKIYAFSKGTRFIHLLAAISWIILVPTGLIIMFGKEFGGGFFVRTCRYLHDFATVIFAIAILPMFVIWFKRMLPTFYDIKWMMIVGGYLSKNIKTIPAGKFNAGQKMWYWVAMLGGFFMILTGAAMFFIDFNIPSINSFLGLSQIEILRLSAIVHNILGIVCATFLLVHIYMSVFAIKGAIHSMISGYMEEEEVYVLHHYWYRELLDKGKIQKSKYEEQYARL